MFFTIKRQHVFQKTFCQVCLVTGLINGMERWNGKWNGLECRRMFRGLTCFLLCKFVVKNVPVQISRDTVHVCYTRGEREGERIEHRRRGEGEERWKREERREGEGRRGEGDKGGEERERGTCTGN